MGFSGMKSSNILVFALVMLYLIAVYQCLISVFKANSLLKKSSVKDYINHHLQLIRFSGILLLVSQLSFLVSININISLSLQDILLNIIHSFFLFSILPFSLGICTTIILIYVLLHKKKNRLSDNDTCEFSKNQNDLMLKHTTLSVFLKVNYFWIIGLNVFAVVIPCYAEHFLFTVILFIIIENSILVLLRSNIKKCFAKNQNTC